MLHSKCLLWIRRAGRFGTKGLAITFVSSDADQEVMAAIQARFEVAVPELPDSIDPASYSTSSIRDLIILAH
jgi:ATP-dependent RNA helicase UAP56/SUB2